MARAEGALFRTAETVPAASSTRAATSFSVTLPGWLRRDFLLFSIGRDYRRPLMIIPHSNSSIAPNRAMGWLAALRAAEEIARTLNDPTAQAKYHELFARSQASSIKKLWNGEY